jgi:DMSO/TMAO reductase YedYZ molybdopterin-dependent catalytic subunit
MRSVMTETGQPIVRRYLAGAVSGMLTAAVALGVAELAAAATGSQGAPVIAVGETAINLTPIGVKDFAIAHFGSHDKEALITGIVIMLIGFAALIGALAVRRIWFGLAGLVVFAGVGIAAAIHLPNATAADAVPTLAGVAVSAGALIILVRSVWAAFPAAPHREPGGHAVGGSEAGGPKLDGTELDGTELDGTELDGTELTEGPYLGDLAVSGAQGPQGMRRAGAAGKAGALSGPVVAADRRRFLIAGAGAAALAAATGWAGDKLLGRFSIASSRAEIRLPAAAVTAKAAPAGVDFNIPGITPFFTSNNSFYRVDTDLVLPQVSPESWTLKIDGMVDRELEFTFAELLKMPLTENDMTLVCVSNSVGGTYNGNARWLGVPLAGVLRKAGVKAGADQILSAATDGMTISTPIQTIMDTPGALLAVGMNGQPLPIAHGFPARMLVPGLYGYVSATKWVTKLTVTTFAASKAYWTQRGYTAQAPIKTESRIDVPKPLAQVKAGHVTVAGVAWAPAKGIAAVEVNVDNGPWHQATLAAVDSIETWRQWMWDWDATSPGLHTLQVRATDHSGATQTSARAQVFPNGASGWDSTVVTVT